jgi:hypothetical protein
MKYTKVPLKGAIHYTHPPPQIAQTYKKYPTPF